jgi:hypothetical protein
MPACRVIARWLVKEYFLVVSAGKGQDLGQPWQWQCQDKIYSSLNYLLGSAIYRRCTDGGGEVCGRNAGDLLKRKNVFKKSKTAPLQTVDYG